jgi:DNA (cytosine-5)-methyltransferase 1
MGRRQDFTFIDLFAGIGGMRMAFESAGGQCKFSSEWDPRAKETYQANFGEEPFGDINEIAPKDIPDHDVLVAGFPCQPFSLAGVSKKNSLGRPHGFLDQTQGTLFFTVARILEAKRPLAFVLENVKHLERHNKGRTFEVIKGTLENDLKYKVFTKVIDASAVVPQHRERIFIVGFDADVDFRFPVLRNRHPRFRQVLDRKVPEKYTLSNHLWKYLQAYAAKHKALGNGFGCTVTDLDGIARTLSARYHKDGSEILVPQGRGRNPRRLTPRECARLMGFKSSFRITVSDTAAYRQFGNSVVVPVVTSVAKAVAGHIPEVRHSRAQGLQTRRQLRLYAVA